MVRRPLREVGAAAALSIRLAMNRYFSNYTTRKGHRLFAENFIEFAHLPAVSSRLLGRNFQED